MVEHLYIKKDQFIPTNDGKIQDFYDFGKNKETLGEGTYGMVRVATLKATGQKRAIKTIAKSKITKMERFKTEVSIMRQLDHPNVIKLYETFEDARHVHLVMEICTGGELFDRIIKKGYFSEKDAAVIFKQMISALAFCHKNGICHRDLKPENFLFSDPSDTATIKMIDFGLSHYYSKTGKPEEKVVRMHTKAGTPYYISPEVLAGDYDEKCDIWSAGVILYILMCGYPPFYGDTDPQILDAVRSGKFDFDSSEWDLVSQDAKAYISSMLVKDVSKRPSAEVCLHHSWVAELAPNALTANLSNSAISALKAYQASEKLKKATLHYIASQLTEKEIGSLKDAFLALDANGDGTLTISELQTGISKLHDWTNRDFSDLMTSLDTDGSGCVDYSEFLAATIDKNVYLQEEKLWDAFKMFDKDGSGKISPAELKEVLGRGKEYMDDKIWEQMVKEVDLNGDGEIDFEEFLYMMEKVRSD
mmetsp:Transcript_45608/g.52525  ORF Transcript_45608/g.52525 Transcript_45608/m.52525 type:complete len:475 (+) Transcript_45608:69-1493(+)|eukprot:CAMPEP_0114995790 /NCGR_PEP_ID=MMETSP0216-20121206/13935_1 /TAXON_ID=223996 /ORGANISM="Protocruzia adherens, Strain Boccale" /LENGTH=474 /DNA_ID=CAMNT_0002359891 /DNA_START=48 /DNA_END=1472 /DNA_ORIENTATION=-